MAPSIAAVNVCINCKPPAVSHAAPRPQTGVPPAMRQPTARRRHQLRPYASVVAPAPAVVASGPEAVFEAQQAYNNAVRASLSRNTLTTDDLLASALPAVEGPSSLPRLLVTSRELSGTASASSCPADDTLVERFRAQVEECIERWDASPQTLAAFNTEASLAVPGLADVAIISRGGRKHDCWKGCNQDAYVATSVGSADSPALLLGVFDGHGRGGELASRQAASNLAVALPALRSQHTASSQSGSGCEAPASQQALVAAMQGVAAEMQREEQFEACGSAALACVVEPGCITAAWCGDCRAVVGLSVDTPAGPSMLVHSLTQDHKPHSQKELARIKAVGKGRVLTQRLCAKALTEDRSLSLSRAFGDAWAVPLGLTAEPDAVTLTLPPPIETAAASSQSGQGVQSLLTAGSASSDASDEEGATSPACGPARHALVLGCDGLWDMVTSSDAVAIAMSCATAEDAAAALMHTARRRWAARCRGEHMDDVTVAVVFLPC